jgi:hypothetical protein
MRDWNGRLVAWSVRFPSPVDRAFVGGFHADRVGYAFAAGYQCALHAIDPTLPVERIASFCATESGGAHPRSIATSLVEDGRGAFVLTGSKRWSTMAPDADVLLVIATRGKRADGQNDLVVVRVAADAPGVKRAAMETTKFIPEITHAEITFDETHVMPEAILPGDGYTQYLKAFRTVEDIHVHAAILGHLVRVARLYAWPQKFVQHAVALGVALRSVGTMPTESATTHIALAGVIDASRDLVEHSAEYWPRVDDDVRHRWQRDLPLLQVADNARTQRTERAWLKVQGSPEDYR